MVKLIDSRISIYSAHTNLDKLFYDKLAKIAGFETVDLIYPHEPAPDGITAGFGALALLWITSGFMALRRIVRGDVHGHRRRMTRKFALTLAAVTSPHNPARAAAPPSSENCRSSASITSPRSCWSPHGARFGGRASPSALIGSLRPEFFVTRGQAISLSTLAWIRAISSSKNSPR